MTSPSANAGAAPTPTRRPAALHISAALQVIVIAALIGLAVLNYRDSDRFSAAAAEVDQRLSGGVDGGFILWDLAFTAIALTAAAVVTLVAVTAYAWPSWIARIPLIVVNVGTAVALGGLATLTAAVALFSTPSRADLTSNDYTTAVNAVYFGNMTASYKAFEILLAAVLVVGPVVATVFMLLPSVSRFQSGRAAVRRSRPLRHQPA